MLFNSYTFLFAYLPIVLAGYQIAARWHRRAVVVWLSLASLAFYAYWRPAYLILLAASILFNYGAGCLITRRIPTRLPPRGVMLGAVAVNLTVLCFYKYLFPVLNLGERILASPHRFVDVVLPLGISFFTFTQIAYLVDLEQGGAVQQDLASYTLFATFFPHLIAGPILHHSEIMPQFQQDRDYRLRADDLAIGFSWFLMGMAKKVLLADRFAMYADPAFAAAANITTLSAWIGVLSYALQLYFDFSGYSDMALGLARMFSIDFPLNFSSPYKAPSIIDFWQRWHMTLTRYINSYLYNPVSLWVRRRRLANGKKVTRKAIATPAGFLSMIAAPTFLSLFLAGIWHGAGLQFIVFGLLHASYLTINHVWRVWRGGQAATPAAMHPALRAVGYASRVLLTFGCVLLAQIFFRAVGMHAALHMLAGLVGLHNPAHLASGPAYDLGPILLVPIALGFAIVWGLPNTQQILANFSPAIEVTAADREANRVRIVWRPTLTWGLALGALFFAVLIKMENPSSFLYFQF